MKSPQSSATGRFAPSTTGPAHPGTLLAALLCWLDARSQKGRILLRLEDLDPDRCRPEYAEQMIEDLEWLGLDWDDVTHQSSAGAEHEAALDHLADQGLLYPCECTRKQIRAHTQTALDGGTRYPGTCRGTPLPARGWRRCELPLRVALPHEGRIEIEDESGLPISQDPEQAMGDPIVRRRDGAVAYHLAGVVDDGSARVNRVVRGRDLAVTTATQVALQRALSLERPGYRHHLLLLEERGGKLAKLHGAVGAAKLRQHYNAAQLCGLLAHAAGFVDTAEPTTPRNLLEHFNWQKVAEADVTLRWTGTALEQVSGSPLSAPNLG
jgi:glutamyl/glutaminyl-tRNA synthetase